MAIILISQGFRGVDFLRKPPAYLHFKAFAGPTIDVVLGWDLPDASLAFALNAQANFMAGIDPEQIIGFCQH
jgi:hypothetical protein